MVYNHTAEGNHLGPTLSLPGIDNGAYYRLVEDDQRYYMDYTGTGNSLNVRHPHSLQLIMDSLRYWVTEMHVDGFRFDLAATLAREFYEVDRLSTFFELVQQDPVVTQVKLIAEPWDVGPGGYQVGNFPPQWTEWNGKYRDTVRDFWRGEPATLGEFASRLTGSSDLYEHSGRRPVAEHQLRHRARRLHAARPGLLQREAQRGQRRGQQRRREPQPVLEPRRRGPDRRPARSWRCAPAQQRNFLATLLLCQGVPMLLHGDELGRTQQGNNNTYCPGLRAHLGHWDEADTAAGRVHRRGRPAARRAPDVPPQALLHRHDRAHRATASAQRHRLAAPRRATPMETGGLGRRLGTVDRDVPQRPRHRRHATPAASAIVDDHFLLSSTPTTTRRVHPAARASTPQAWDVVIDTGGVGRTTSPGGKAAAATLTDGAASSVVVLRRARGARGRAGPLGAPRRSLRSRPSRADEPARRSAATPSRARRTGQSSLDRCHADHVDLPAADHRRASTCSTAARRRCPTCTTSASTGSTSRRCWPREPGSDHGYDVVDHDARSTRRGAAATGWPRCRRRRARLGHGRARRHRAQPRRRRRRRRRTRGGGTCCARPRARATPRPSTSTGTPATAGSCSRSLGDDDRRGRRRSRPDASTGELRYHDHRFPLAPGTATGGDGPARCTTAQHYELVELAARRRRAQLPALLRGHHAGRRPGRGPARSSTSRTSRSRAGSTRASSTGCGSTTPTACATRGLPRRPAPTLTGGAYVLVEKILEPGEELPRRWATARAPPATTRSPSRPGARRPGRRGAARRARGPAARRRRSTGTS